MRPLIILRSLRALWRAHTRPKRKPSGPRKLKNRERMRRRALRKLGGACACCGLDMERFAPALVIHHLNGNGSEHRTVLSAIGLSLVQWVLVSPTPGQGLFAVEVLCEVCHRMNHELGRCPHGKVLSPSIGFSDRTYGT